MPKIHYLAKDSLYPACGRGGYHPQTSSDIKKVTCRACTNTVYGQNSGGGRPPDPKGQNAITIKISDRAFQNWQRINKGLRSQTVSDFLEGLAD